MPRTILLAAALTASTACSASADVFRWKWEGAVRIVSQSGTCTTDYVTDENIRAIYQPNLVGVDDRRTSLLLFRQTVTEMLQKIDSGQFSGSGNYDKFTLGNGRLYESYSDEDQAFDFVQKPAVVNATTPFITLVGTLSDYGGGASCVVTLRGAFTGVDTTEEPPPPPYGG